MKRLAAITIATVLVASCSSGTSAPATQPMETVCADAFCFDAPEGWGGEIGETFIAFHHDVDPEATFLTANVVDMEAVVTAAGGSWPVQTDEVVRSFWALLEEVDEGSLIRTERMVGGAVRSWGTHSTGDMWFVLVPVSGSVGIGVEIRGPNGTWETHADAVFPTVVSTD